MIQTHDMKTPLVISLRLRQLRCHLAIPLTPFPSQAQDRGQAQVGFWLLRASCIDKPETPMPGHYKHCAVPKKEGGSPHDTDPVFLIGTDIEATSNWGWLQSWPLADFAWENLIKFEK